jgi:glutamate--cysteine ligase
LTLEEVNKTKEDMVQIGLQAKLADKTLLEIGKELIKLAKNGLKDEDKRYLNPLEDMLNKGKSPYEIVKEKSKISKKEALKDCLLNNLSEVKR